MAFLTSMQSEIESVTRCTPALFFLFRSDGPSFLSGRRGPAQHQQIVRNHRHCDPALYAAETVVTTPTQSVATFQGADAPFTACTPLAGALEPTRSRSRAGRSPFPATALPQDLRPRLQLSQRNRTVRDSSSSGTVRRSAVCSNTSPCWINSEVIPAVDQDFPMGSCAHHGCWAHTNWIGNEKSPTWKMAAGQHRPPVTP